PHFAVRYRRKATGGRRELVSADLLSTDLLWANRLTQDACPGPDLPWLFLPRIPVPLFSWARSCSCLLSLGVCISEQFFEQSTVVNHGFPQIFGAGLTTVVAEGDSVCGTIVFHHHGMIDGDVGGALLEVCHGISASLHQLVDEL